MIATFTPEAFYTHNGRDYRVRMLGRAQFLFESASEADAWHVTELKTEMGEVTRCSCIGWAARQAALRKARDQELAGVFEVVSIPAECWHLPAAREMVGDLKKWFGGK